MIAALAAVLALGQTPDPSAVAMGHDTMIGVGASRTSGDRSSLLGGDRAFERDLVEVHVRGGSAARELRSLFGAQIGWEYAFAAGFAPAAEGEEEGDLFVLARSAVPLRVHAFNVPFDGMIAIHAGLEVSSGGGVWWSDGVRLAPELGLRVAAHPGGPVRFEIGYALVPHVFQPDALGGPGGEFEVNRVEHRVSLDLALGALGFGVGFVQGLLEVRGDAGLFEDSDDTALDARVELRF